MKIAVISLTKNGTDLNLKISKSMGTDGFTLEKYQNTVLKSFSNIHDIVKLVFEEYQGLIFIGACGIAVRCIAPYIKSKLTDIPVVVCDELGKYAIPILSGHLGGANELANQVAKITGGLPIITTATDINDKFAVDVWAKDNNLAILEPPKIKDISSAILDNIPVGFYSNISIVKPKDLTYSNKIGIAVSNRVDISPFENTLHLLPRNLVLGIGCKKFASMINIENLVLDTLDTLNFSILSIKKVCSIDLKSNEIGLLEFCSKYAIEVKFFSSNELNSIQGDFSKSKFVESVTNVDCVCERSAIRGSNNGKLIQKKIAQNGVTLAIAIDDLH
ncbi:MAG: cobalt-precorrin 5A hydrolase [Oscillospiraceae bacterium]